LHMGHCLLEILSSGLHIIGAFLAQLFNFDLSLCCMQNTGITIGIGNLFTRCIGSYFLLTYALARGAR
jgi:hypothetical protein